MEARLFLALDPAMLIYFSQRSSYCRRASVKFTATPFFVPLQLLLGGLLIEAEAGQPAFSPPANPPTVRTLSEMVKKLWWSSLWSPGTFRIAPSSSPHKAVWSLSWLTSWERQTLVKSGVNRFNQHITGPKRVSWHSLDDHSPLQRQYWWWTQSRWDFSDLPPPILRFRLLIIAYSCVLIKALTW